MSNLRPVIRSALSTFCNNHEGDNTSSDILRAIYEEAYLMKETQDIYDLLDSDPMEQFQDIQPQIERLKRMVQVTSCSRRQTGPFPDSCTIHSVVTFRKPFTVSSSSSVPASILQLTFRYERRQMSSSTHQDGDKDNGCHVRYTIEVSTDHGERETLLLVEVFAPHNFPSTTKPAICINDDDDPKQLVGLLNRGCGSSSEENDDDDDDEEGGWEDMDEEEDINAESNKVEPDDVNEQDTSRKAAKKQKICEDSMGDDGNGDGDDDDDDDKEEGGAQKKLLQDIENGPEKKLDDENDDDESETNMECDAYRAYMDPNLLDDFLQWANLMPMGEATAFFLLMTFPYYEHEWDLVGYVLDEVFGSESDDENEDDDDEE